MNAALLFDFEDALSARVKQQELSARVVEKGPRGFRQRLVCGLDAAYSGRMTVGVATVYDLSNCLIVEKWNVAMRVRVPYVPGLLGFREGPVLVAAAEKFETAAEVFLVDGHGRAHPRSFGLACHVGLALDKPTVGVAKSNLYGAVKNGRMLDPDGRVLGRVLGFGERRAFYVSVGHRIGLNSAVDIVRKCMLDGYPAPLRAAHLEAARLRRTLKG